MLQWQKTPRVFILTATLVALGWAFLDTACPSAETSGNRWKNRTELQLTEDFYHALRSEGAKTYPTSTCGRSPSPLVLWWKPISKYYSSRIASSSCWKRCRSSQKNKSELE
jgi:hypothetical protein